MGFIWLLFAHFIGDFAFQNRWMAEKKGEYTYIMLAHCIVWTACICVALQFLGIYAPWKVLFLVMTHWIGDKWKTEMLDEVREDRLLHLLYIDQAWHFITLIPVFIFT